MSGDWNVCEPGTDIEEFAEISGLEVLRADLWRQLNAAADDITGPLGVGVRAWLTSVAKPIIEGGGRAPSAPTPTTPPTPGGDPT